jgi:hypothetical protein
LTLSSPDAGTENKEQAMSRYEKRIYFESLVAMRIAYAQLGADDRTSVMSIDEAIAWAELELEATESTPTTEA